MAQLNSDSSLLFATFSPYIGSKRDPKNGNIDPFVSFFSKKIRRFVLLDQPHIGSSFVEPIVEDYLNGKLKKKYKLKNKFYEPFYKLLRIINPEDGTNIIFKIRDLVSVVHVGLASKEKLDYFVGLESINTFGGIILRKLGKVDKVIYYVSDYSPSRYNNKLFNDLYLFLDRFCCYNSDFIWDVSLAMQPARIKAGLDGERSAPVIHVPNALFPNYIKHLKEDKLIDQSIVFMGSLGLENGPDLAIEAMPSVLRKYPKASLHVIGGGRDLARLKDLAKENGIEDKVKFYGMIPSDLEMLSILRKFYIGLAPYKQILGSVRMFGDSLKLRYYMASGIPVITTPVPPLGKELEGKGSALIVSDDPKSLSKAIIELLSNKEKYKKLRSNAILYGSTNTWDNTFKYAFNQMQNHK